MMSNNLLKACNIKELAAMYHVTLKTMRTWLKPFQNKVGPRIGHNYTPLQVGIIFDCLGLPD